MKTFYAITAAGRSIIEIAVVLAMFTVARTPFEIIIVSGLALIYLAIRDLNIYIWKIVKLFLSLKPGLADGDTFKSVLNAEQMLQPSTWIRRTSDSIVGVIAIWHLIRAVI